MGVDESLSFRRVRCKDQAGDAKGIRGLIFEPEGEGVATSGRFEFKSVDRVCRPDQSIDQLEHVGQFGVLEEKVRS